MPRLIAVALLALGFTWQGCDQPPKPIAVKSDPVPLASPPVPPGRCVRTEGKAPRRPEPKPGPDPKCPEDPGRPKLRWARVTFPHNGETLDVELAETEDQRQRGLMYRKELPETHGMLFLFNNRGPRRFWMKNTCLPLDMMFIDGDGLIVGIEENVPTMNENSYSVGCASQYVLEVGAGWSRRHGVRPGNYARFEGL